MFFNGSGFFYPQSNAVISAWFVDRYFDQGGTGMATPVLNHDSIKGLPNVVVTQTHNLQGLSVALNIPRL